MADATSSLRSRVLAATAASPSPTRRQGRIAAQASIAASVAVAVTIFESIGGVDHGSGRPLGITIALAGGWTLASSMLTWLVLARSGSTMARWTPVVGLLALASPLLLFGWMHLFYGTYPEPYQAVGYRCLRYTLFISAVPLASFLVLRRAVEPRHPSALGAGAGAACAAWAGALVDLWCPLTDPMHVLIGHVLPIAIAVVAGAAVGHFTLGARRAHGAP